MIYPDSRYAVKCLSANRTKIYGLFPAIAVINCTTIQQLNGLPSGPQYDFGMMAVINCTNLRLHDAFQYGP